MLQGKKILLGVTGSIAAYKSLLLVRLLIREGVTVRVIQTPASRDFVTPLSLSTLSKNPVLSDLFATDTWANHVELGRWADLLVIAPLSCNTLAKMATGLCDNLLVATYLSATCPVIVAPAMDEDMWNHPSTRLNLQKLQSYGNRVIPVGKGELASGLFGDGRMAEPEMILEFIRSIQGEAVQPAQPGQLSQPQLLSGKRTLVTAGPTHESIDPVRFIGNHSSGKMGIAIARELAQRGAQVTLILGPSALSIEEPGITVQRVTTAAQMFDACIKAFDDAHLAVLSAAVADYTPAAPAPEKIKKNDGSLMLELVKTRDILKTLGEMKKTGQLLVGFALETRDGREYALGKLKAKNADFIVLNTLEDQGAGFGLDTNKITIFGTDGFERAFATKSKQQVAKDIVDTIVKSWHA
ncbi:MAG TPA: bifunctional phosphopantothenoylcysteine decarboxylase/phosphopantothenate--cysteine ligase CoaBC [Puia sp.]|nr:bifunctional phosphopantothenoylcysteine decarboxylase/phosphopantothenate--cysteine ligase CoaBC [Puia sp.]